MKKMKSDISVNRGSWWPRSFVPETGWYLSFFKTRLPVPTFIVLMIKVNNNKLRLSTRKSSYVFDLSNTLYVIKRKCGIKRIIHVAVRRSISSIK